MAKKVHCAIHGECEPAFVCSHLVGETVGLGFNRSEPERDNPFPNAWCDDCELIRAEHDGWNEQSEKLIKISLLCSGCYERARIRNTRTAVTLDDLAGLRWKCGSCEEWHTGPCLDFGYDSPYHWRKQDEEASSRERLGANWSRMDSKTFLDKDYCAIEDAHFYVRGVIHLPIIGSTENFCWGVWGSLKRENFKTLLKMDKDPKRSQLAPMFSWLSNQIPEYPDTLKLKMYAHIQKPDWRPRFELEPTDHPLSQEYHKGITPERVKRLMMTRLPSNE